MFMPSLKGTANSKNIDISQEGKYVLISREKIYIESLFYKYMILTIYTVPFNRLGSVRLFSSILYFYFIYFDQK